MAAAAYVQFRDEYAVTRKLGSGSFGVVFECRSIATQEIYAAKVMKRKKDSDGDRGGGEKRDREKEAEEFEREIRIPLSLGDCAAPYLVRVVAVYPREQVIVMEKAETDLRAYMENPANAPLSEAAVASLCRVVCAGLEMFHDRGLMHRDLKPANILLRDASNIESAVLADFGSSRQLDKDTMAATYAPGTPIYSAPEMINFSAETIAYNHQVDMWSLGIIAFELLAGEIPFQARSLLGLFAEIQNPALFLAAAEVRCPRWAGASPCFRDFVTRLLDTDPTRRLSARRCLYHPFISRDQPIEATGTIDLLPAAGEGGGGDAITASIVVAPSQFWFGTAAGRVGFLSLNPTPMAAEGTVTSEPTGERICSMVHNDAAPGDIWTSSLSPSGVATVRVWRVVRPGAAGIGYLALGSSQDDAYVRDGHLHWGDGAKRKCVPLRKAALPQPPSYTRGKTQREEGGGRAAAPPPIKTYGTFFWKEGSSSSKKKRDSSSGGGSGGEGSSSSLCYTTGAPPSSSSSPHVPLPSRGGGGGGGDAVTVATFKSESEARPWKALFARVRELEAAAETIVCVAASLPPLAGSAERTLPPPKLTVLDGGRVISVRDSTVLLESWEIEKGGGAACSEIQPQCIERRVLGTAQPAASSAPGAVSTYVNWPVMRVSPSVLAVALPRQIVLFSVSSVTITAAAVIAGASPFPPASIAQPGKGSGGSSSSSNEDFFAPQGGEGGGGVPVPLSLSSQSSSFDRLLLAAGGRKDTPSSSPSSPSSSSSPAAIPHKVIPLDWDVRCAIALPTRREIWVGHDIAHGICVHPLQQRPLASRRRPSLPPRPPRQKKGDGGEGGDEEGQSGERRDTSAPPAAAAAAVIRINVNALAALGFEGGDVHRPVTALAVSPSTGDAVVWGTLRTGYLFSIDVARREIVSTVSIGDRVEYGIYPTVLHPYISHLGFPQLLVGVNPRRVVWWTSKAENIRRRRDARLPMLAIGATGAPIASLTPRNGGDQGGEGEVGDEDEEDEE